MKDQVNKKYRLSLGFPNFPERTKQKFIAPQGSLSFRRPSEYVVNKYWDK